MSFKDEMVYCFILLSSIGAGNFLRLIKDPLQKQLLSTIIGFVTVATLCGYETLYSVAVICGTLGIIKSHSRQTPLLAFVFVFTFLLFFRCASFFGLQPTSAIGNAVQLILTLKLISVAIEIHDCRWRKLGAEKSKETSATKFQLLLEDEPGVFDIFCYSYCYIGLFTGPFFKFRTYHDFLHQNSELIPWKEEVTNRGKQVALYGSLYLVASRFFSVGHVKSDEFYEHGFWYRLLYMVAIFFLGRMRFYSAWLLSECSFVTAAFGAYPKSSKPRPGHGPTLDSEELRTQDPAAVEYSFEAVRNINPSGSEWSATVRDGMRNWNMSVQWWLANYVHRRWPTHLKAFRTAAVLGCSAYWHGIAPGFFGAFLSMPFFMAAEDMLIGLVRKKLPENMHKHYDWINWFFKMRSFEYMYMAFALLTWEDTYRWWKSVYFVGHIACFLILIVCIGAAKLLKTTKKRVEQKKE